MKFGKLFRLIRHPKTLIRKLLHRLPKVYRNKLLRFPNEKMIESQMKNMLARKLKNPIIIFPSPSCPWGYLFQRPQQLARAFANLEYTVIYLVDTSFVGAPDWGVRGLFQIEKNLYLYNDGFDGEFLKKSLGNEKILIWQYWPHQRSNIKEHIYNTNSIQIYDCIDHINTFDNYNEIQTDFEISLMKSDYILATANGIAKDLLQLGYKSLLVPNGVNIDDFLHIKTTVWEDLDELRQKSKVIVGYYGAIANWFDFTTIRYAAEMKPDWTFLIVGEVYPDVEKYVQELAGNCRNVLFRSRVTYEYIPQLLSYFDIAVLPFKINEITLNTSPVKIFEYLAGGKPVVSSNLPEVSKISSVLISNNKIEFYEKLLEAESLKNNELFRMSLIKEAEENTWEKRLNKVLSRVEELL
ncbi:glycosyltransferase [Paenibacillus sp. 5J-6]|uniref:Glycosyltransferase n=1 Tax=Paenibacillus silvestris TaxID=2606219 RepID=A0A6L8V1Z6_9BACL|nr:glycosyltransferase [Paenibacillus silvestris]MZQ83732.1 glycosyltransferase [Paenibacillus silvestris]